MKTLRYLIGSLALVLLISFSASAQRVATKYTKLSVEVGGDKHKDEYLALDFDVQLVDCLRYVKFHYVKNNKQETIIVDVNRDDYYMENGMVMCHLRLAEVKEFSNFWGNKDILENISYEVVSKTGRTIHRDNLTAYYNMLYDSGSIPLTRK